VATFTKTEKPQDAALVQPRDRTRSPDQIALDELVKTDLVTPWEAAGKPLPLTDEKTGLLIPNPASPDLALKVAKKDKTEFKDMVRRSLTPHKLVPVWYTDGKEDTDGNVVVTFQAGPRPEPKKKEETQAADGQAQGDQPQGDQPQGGQPQGDQPQGTGDQGGDQPQATPAAMPEKKKGLLGR